jgi:hypothetical protein
MSNIVSKPIMSIAESISNSNIGFKISKKHKQSNFKSVVAWISLVLHNLFAKTQNKVHLPQDIATCTVEVANFCAEVLSTDNLNESFEDTKLLISLQASLKFQVKAGILYINIQENSNNYWFPQENLLLSVHLSKKAGTLAKFKTIAHKIEANKYPNSNIYYNNINELNNKSESSNTLFPYKEKLVRLTNDPQKTVTDFNAGKLNLCVTMLGYQIDQYGYNKVINKNTSQVNENTFAARKSKRTKDGDNLGSDTNFSATAFNNKTQVNLIRSRKLVAEKKMPNVGYIFNPDKLEKIQVAAPGDAWTNNGGKLMKQEVLDPKKSPDPKTITKYVSTESNNCHKITGKIVEPKNKAYKGDKVRDDNKDTLRALVKHTNKHGWGAQNAYKKHVAKSETTNELLVMPSTEKYFDSIDYIIVDNSQLKHPDITQHKNWQGITALANSVNKPILILQADGKTIEYYDQKKINISSEQMKETFVHVVESVENVNLTDFQQNISKSLIDTLPKNRNDHIASPYMNGMPGKYFPLNITLSGEKDSQGKYLLAQKLHKINLDNVKDYETKFTEIFQITPKEYCDTFPMLIFKNKKMEHIAKKHYSDPKYKWDPNKNLKLDCASNNILYCASNDIESCIAKTASICANYGVLSFKNPDVNNDSTTTNVPGILYDAVGLNKTNIEIDEYNIFCKELYSTVLTASKEQNVCHLIISPVGAGVMSKDKTQKQNNKMALLQALLDSSLDENAKVTILDYNEDYNTEYFEKILATIKQKFPNLVILSGKKDANFGGIALSNRVQKDELTGLVNASAPAAYGGLMTQILGDHTIEENIRHHMAGIMQPDVRIGFYPNTIKIIEV